MTPIAKALGSALIAMILGVVFAAFSCSRTDTAKSGPGAASCKTRFADVVSYMKRFKNANVLTTDVAVPPDEAKTPKPLAYDAKRRLVECDAEGCRFGVTTPITYGKTFTQALRSRVAPGKGACSPVYLALDATLPVARYSQILTAVSGCPTFALRRSSLQKLPSVEPSAPTVDRLKVLGSAKNETERRNASKTLVTSMLRPYPKTCGKTREFLTTVASAKGYEKFTKVVDGLESRRKDFEPCVCSLNGQDDKVLFQVAGFQRLGGMMFVYSAKQLKANAKGAKAKTWYDYVRTN